MRCSSIRLVKFLLAVGVVVSGSVAVAAEPAPHGFQTDLTPETLPALHALIRPHDHEWRHLRVRWLTDVVAARRQAAAEDKPIVVLYTGGAGYNEPLGIC
jgi:hypothetical protein